MIAGLVKGTLLCTEESPRKTPFTALNHPASCSVAVLNGLARGQVVVFSLKLAVEPAGQITQRFSHALLGAVGGRLPGRAITVDVHGHGVFVVVATAVADLGSELVEVPPLDGLQPVGYAMQRRVRRGVVPDARGRALGVGPVTFEASPVALAPEA
jgi:hypothetical protein